MAQAAVALPASTEEMINVFGADSNIPPLAPYPPFAEEDVISGRPNDHQGIVLYRDPLGRFSVGVWTCPPGKFIDRATGAEAMLASGELDSCYLWSGPVFRLQEQGIPVEYMMNPKGGIISWVCGLVMTSNGEGDEQAAYDFIDAWNSPEAGKFLVEVYGYGHANRLTYDLVDPAILDAMGLSGGVDAYLANSSPYRSWEPALLESYIAMFEDVKVGT
ncbi:MAG: extracellular solute-binding protein [Rhodospirillaceae bacterium]|nr:extracellular solute-binding protein [Rhodospirillaceae bacterium]MBT6204616.1 extracellular solute-binding protein [Rhodospirillaceae bacterium]MBT6511609.1 extracellular solute-binding protein [Rhodospirillaceae bacterium]MBT7611909.1 extracellular solute-binding protein [Rhodospirillaceae bacterium]MBT7646422.1 extracellular solute-binding protein [Rhodospirillaceae bacterium]